MNAARNAAVALSANAALALPSVALPNALPAVGIPAARRSTLGRAFAHHASLIGTLTLLASSAAYCVYALGTLAN